MLTKIDNTLKYGKQHGGFGIQILYPGLAFPDLHDTGFATIGRIDHARITPGTLIPMHQHQNDEILTYLRNGTVKHKDTERQSAFISNQKLMLMNAGASYSHEELVLKEGETLEGLQIFIRPEKENLKPQVQFFEMPEIYSKNSWRKIAGKGNGYPLKIRSNTWLMDLNLDTGRSIALPDTPDDDICYLLYVFNGQLQVNSGVEIKTGESVMIEGERPLIHAVETSDIVLFMTQKNACFFDGGMYSGNLH